MVKRLLFLILILSTLSVKAQIETFQLIEGMTINSSKNQAINVVVKKMKEYIHADRNEIQKALKKNGHKINQKSMDAFFTKMEQDIRADLQNNDDWDKTTIQKSYVLSSSDILGYYLQIPGFDKANTNKMGNGSLRLKFKDGKIISLNSSVNTTKHQALPSGFGYNNDAQDKITSSVTKHFGNFKLVSSTGTTWQCSSSGDKIYYENFEFSKNEFHGSVHHTFSPMFKSTGINTCASQGAQLTLVQLDIKRQQTQETDYKKMN